ncbi:MAG: polyhydroxyalkanoate depolymerase [Hyphomicrobium sp.]|nr:polyhydroxyalkanoate depolymerase [Hyphomicrobium sp.]
MHYYAYELAHAIVRPMRFGAEAMKFTIDNPLNPMSATPFARAVSAACEVFENVTRRYGKPSFGLKETKIGGVAKVPVHEEIALAKPFCNLLHFKRDILEGSQRFPDPKVLIVAPMSGHYATLLRGTVASMMEEHDVYITDWADAREVPVIEGKFDLDSFIDYLIEFMRFLGPNTHVIAVCQPAVPALAATALMAQMDDYNQPASLTLMGGPIDTRRNPTKVNELARNRSIDWFERNVIDIVPFPHPGMMRRVYPGFLQLTGFMTMNLDRHMNAHVDLFSSLVKGDCDSVKQHQDFYEEYLAVMDLTAEFYLQTVKTVFQDHALPDGFMTHRNMRVNCKAIKKTALITIEGERDDICGIGQTEAAQLLCTNIPDDERFHYVQPGVGHYGVFNGTRWRTEIQPRIRQMIRYIHKKRASANPFERLSASSTKSGLPGGFEHHSVDAGISLAH